MTEGTQLGPYRIEAPIGAGGMGEVYRATDTRLRRTVAIKVLPRAQVADPERKKRFLQEARAASALNHPNIVTLHDIAHDAGEDYLVMEFVPGKSLNKLIPPKGLKIAEALHYAQQIASGLAAAHTAGIVHRDMKPGNVMVTAESQVKILDFGLAKLVERAPSAEGETRTEETALTESGTIIGTVSYMSPEQASASPLDHRTDIFSLGAILYEMLAGARPFRGASAVETLHAIIRDPAPTLTAQPPELQEILDKTLAKDPKDRYQHAGDLAIDLRRFEKVWESKSLPSLRTETVAAPGGRLAWAIAAAGLLIAVGAVWWAVARGTVLEHASLAGVTISPLTSEPGYQGEPSISPDGQTIAYVSDRTGRLDLYLRQIGSSSDIALTRDQGDNIQPAFSPDGRQIAFASSRSGGPVVFHFCCDAPMSGGAIWIMPALGGTGAARRIVEQGNFPSWSPDGSTLVFTRFRAPKLFLVSSGGGEVREVPLNFKSAVPAQFITPVYSSDGRWIFFASFSAGIEFIYAVPASGGTVVELVRGRNPAWDSAAQAVVYVNLDEGKNHALWELPFSTVEGKPGTPRPLTVGRGSDWRPAVSRDGSLIAFSGVTAAFNMELEPFDAEAGKVLGPPRALTSGRQSIYFMRFSPDGRSIVYQSSRGAGTHIWRMEIGGAPVQLTSDPRFAEQFPGISPDGTTISFVRNQTPSPLNRALWLMASDGANPREIGVNDSPDSPPRWLPDGSGLLYVISAQGIIAVRDLAGRETTTLPVRSGTATMPSVSADGKWVVFQYTPKGSSNQGVGAIPLSGGDVRVMVASTHQEMHPFLSPSGRWLYFQRDHKNLYRVPGPAQDWKKADPVKITDFPETGGLFLEDPQISPDGKQLLFSRANISSDIWILKRGK